MIVVRHYSKLQVAMGAAGPGRQQHPSKRLCSQASSFSKRKKPASLCRKVTQISPSGAPGARAASSTINCHVVNSPIMSTQAKSQSLACFDPAFAAEIRSSIERALAEDVGPGDATTDSIVAAQARTEALIKTKQEGVVAGLNVAAAVFQTLDQDVEFDAQVAEGSWVEPGINVATMRGSARSILTAERTALNFLGRMSGVATLTRRFVDSVAGTSAKILDTRKTAPGLRAIDKLAVRLGGGYNHRIGLYDMILIKDNHIDHAGSLTRAVELARAARGDLEI